jgi:hypothetical protein
MADLLQRWKRAAERADEEQVRILLVGGEYRATSTSTPLASYGLSRTEAGWTCECVANREHGLPCKHLSKLADVLGLDVLMDISVDLSLFPGAADDDEAAGSALRHALSA